MSVPIVAIVGWSDSGKTTLLGGLVQELQRRGLRVGVVKHADHPLKLGGLRSDGERLFAAGASSVAVVGHNAVLRFDAGRSSLRGAAATMDVDIVLAEGFKREPGVPKIEVRRTPDVPPCVSDRLALVCDELSDADFRRNDIVGLTDLLLREVGVPGVVLRWLVPSTFQRVAWTLWRRRASGARQPGSNAVVRSVPGRSSGRHSHPGAPGQYC